MPLPVLNQDENQNYTSNKNQSTDQQTIPKKRGKIEILNDVRKLLEKNGMMIADENLLSLLDSIKIAGVTLSRVIELQMPKATLEAQEIIVYPAGKHWIEHENRYLEFDQKFFKEIAESFDNEKLSKPFIDNDHEYKESFGDILGYRIAPEGMYFSIKLNELGYQAIKDNRYKYISPSWGPVVDTEKQIHRNCMATISLTNFPALMGVLPPLQEQIQLSRQNGEKKKMELTRIAKLLELQAEASPEAIAMAIEAMKASIEQLTAALKELEGKAAEQGEVIEEQNRELTQIKKEKLEKEAEEIINRAVELGQYNANEKLIAFKKKEYIENPEKIITELSMIPEMKKQPINKTHTVNMDKLELSDDERDQVIELGFDPEKDADLIRQAGFGKGQK